MTKEQTQAPERIVELIEELIDARISYYGCPESVPCSTRCADAAEALIEELRRPEPAKFAEVKPGVTLYEASDEEFIAELYRRTHTGLDIQEVLDFFEEIDEAQSGERLAKAKG